MNAPRISYGDPDGLRRLIDQVEPIIHEQSNLDAVGARTEQIITHFRLHGYNDYEIGAVVAHSVINYVREYQPEVTLDAAMLTAMVLIRKVTR